MIPVVGECDDGCMADSRTVVAGDVERALGALGTEVAEGSVGAGTGMTCFGFPGGIGTASRRLGEHHLGVLLLCNFGDREYLELPGLEGGGERPRQPEGSCIAVCATDAPLSAQQLRRLALRPLLGLARAGSYATEGSGEIGARLRDRRERRRPGREAQPALRRRLRGGPRGRLQLPGGRAAGAAARRHDAGRVPGGVGRGGAGREGCVSEGDRRGNARGGPVSDPIASAGAVGAMREEAIALARDLIHIDTSNPPGNETAAAELLARYLEGSGAEVELTGPDPRRLNLVARIAGGEGPSLALHRPHRRRPGAARRLERAAVRGPDRERAADRPRRHRHEGRAGGRAPPPSPRSPAPARPRPATCC